MKDTGAYFSLPFRVESNSITNFKIYATTFEDYPEMHEHFDIDDYFHPVEMWADAYAVIKLLKHEGFRITFQPKFVLSEGDNEK